MRAAVFLMCATALVLGCGGNDSEPKRYRVSGKATYDGQPIPFGEVLITPDGAKKNSGPQALAPIRNGQYDTSAAGGKGYGGGSAIVRVAGFDKEGGKVICEREFPVELPASDATKDLDVPKGKAKGAAPEI